MFAKLPELRRKTGCCWRPIPPIWRPFRIAANATNRALSFTLPRRLPPPAASALKTWHRGQPRTSRAFSSFTSYTEDGRRKPMFSKIRQSITAREAFEIVEPDLQEVEREISVESVASVEAITTINQYLQAGGGKRLRPALLLLCNRLFGPSTDCARRLAAVVEMIHTATLVHDDVIDIARTRRGRPSTN